MAQLKPIRVSSLKSFPLSSLYLLCFFFIYNIASLGVNADQEDSDRTIAIPFMQWAQPKLSGTAPPGLKDFAFGYSSEAKVIVIFGGTTPMGTKSGATYIIDLAEYAWKVPSDYGLPDTKSPEARSNMIFGVDKSSSYRNAFIISCGEGSGNTPYNDAWAFDFIYKQWTKIDDVAGESPPPMYDSFGGIDSTLATSSQTVLANTLWASHGRNKTHFFTDLYALFIDGTLSPNIKSLTAYWYKFSAENILGEIPPGRSSPAGTILPNNRLAMYGGCDKPDGNCATSDSYSLDLGSSYVNGKVGTATPIWSKKNSCLGKRKGAAMTMNSNPFFTNQAIVYGGSTSDLKAVGEPGEVGVLNADLGNWVRVLPQKDPDFGYPPQRTGAQMIPIPLPVGTTPTTPPGFPSTSILLFGGENLDGNENDNLNDLWILHLSYNSTSGNTANSNPQITSMTFLKCEITKQTPNDTAKQPVSNTNAGNDNKSNDNDLNIKAPKGHVTFSTISFALLPFAASVIRFGYGSNQKLLTAGLYTTLIVASYATAFYGFVIIFLDKQKLSGHFNTHHGLFGLILLLLLYIFVPLMAVISLCVSKKYESDLISNDDLDNDKGGIGSKLGFLNWRNSESNSKPAKSFEVSRPGNRLASGGEIPSQSPPMSVLKSSDNWMEKRKSVTIMENHPTMSSQGSRNNSLQNDPSSRRTSQSTAVSRSGLQTPIAPLSNYSPSTVIITRRAHHIIAQLLLLLTAIYIGRYLTMKTVDSLYLYIFVVFMAIIYLIWVIAAWHGYPKGRNSLLVLFMHKIFHGKGEINETKQYDFDESGGSGAIPTPTPNRTRTVRIDDDEMDEEAEQAQLEQDMHNREVVVMTIPKRRLTVVNA